jgi:cell wall-associated NlpC family hydrolase
MHAQRASALLLFVVILAGCHSAPPASQDSQGRDGFDPRDWNGGGGAPSVAKRGDAVANFALSLRGTRYRYGGATRDGFDCSGLVFYAHRQFGLSVPRTSRDQSEQAEAVKPRNLEAGDLVFFKIDSRQVNHVGIYIGKRNFVHAPGAGKPVTINSLDDEFYERTFSSAGRFWEQLPH